MKGVVFIALNELVESQYGMAAWEQILAEVNPECGGIYTSTEEYPDEEVVRFVQVISKTLNVDSSIVTRSFGNFLFGELNKKYDIFTRLSEDFFAFLDSIENVIHKEVRKLYNSPNLPTLDCTIVDDKTLIMQYHSPRKLCYLAEGLIQGAAEYYDKEITIEHPVCMHDGAAKCEIHVKIKD